MQRGKCFTTQHTLDTGRGGRYRAAGLGLEGVVQAVLLKVVAGLEVFATNATFCAAVLLPIHYWLGLLLWTRIG